MSLHPIRLSAVPEVSANDVVLRRLTALAALSPLDADRVLALPLPRRANPSGTELCAAGELAPRPRFVIHGWACRVRMLPDGRRQLFDLVLPGDLIGSLAGRRRPAMAATVALTRIETANATAFAPFVADETQPQAEGGLAEALATLERQGEALLLDQVTRLGRQTAYERMAHLMLEIRHRLATVGLVERDSFPMPLRQDTIADLLGLSAVHVNRTLQQMRRDGMIELRGGLAVLPQPDRLREVADFVTPSRPATA